MTYNDGTTKLYGSDSSRPGNPDGTLVLYPHEVVTEVYGTVGEKLYTIYFTTSFGRRPWNLTAKIPDEDKNPRPFYTAGHVVGAFGGLDALRSVASIGVYTKESSRVKDPDIIGAPLDGEGTVHKDDGNDFAGGITASLYDVRGCTRLDMEYCTLANQSPFRIFD